MTTIEKRSGVLTLVNVFTVDQDKQDQLVDLLVRATNEVMKRQPGFVSASIHRSLDGRKVVNYAQWASLEMFEAMKRNDEAASHMKAAASLATFDPILCSVSETISAGPR